LENKLIEIKNLTQLPTIFQRKSNGHIVLSLDFLKPIETFYFQSKINRYYNDCGCSIGALFILLSTPTYVIYTCFFSNYNWVISTKLGVGMFVFLGSAIIGKLIGIYYSRLQLKKTIRHIKWIAKERKEISIMACLNVEKNETRNG